MSTYTYAETFSWTHARRLAGRVTTDLRQSQLFYGYPSETDLEAYRDELEELLAGAYVDAYQFGFKRHGSLVWSLRYIVGPDGALTASGAAGGVPAGINIVGAEAFNFLTFSARWSFLSPGERQKINDRLPFVRVDGSLPSELGGWWTTDRVYVAGGVALQRTVFRTAS